MKGRAISKVAAAVVVVAAVLVIGSAGFLALPPNTNSSTSSISNPGAASSSNSSTYLASSSTTGVGSETTTSSVASSSSLSSTTSSALSAFDFNAAMTTHLADLSSRNIQGAVTAYSSNAVVQWKGQTLSPYGMAGTYSGIGSIRQLYTATIGQMQSLALTVDSFNSTAPSNGSASSSSAVQADAQFTGVGASQMLG